MKVLLSCPINGFTGYGTDGFELADALERWGVDLYLHPSSIHPPLPHSVAKLLTKEIPDHVDLLISHRCPQELASSPESAGLYATATISMAWSMWEWNSLANVDKIQPGNCEHALKVTDVLERKLTSFDLVFAYDEVSKQALDPYHKKVHVLQGGVNPLPFIKRDWSSSPFRFIMVGALAARKNPFAAITAFKELRDAGELKDAELVMKTIYPGMPPQMEQWCPGLKIFEAVWNTAQIRDLYSRSHVLLAPSWGEGKNRPALEFATSGGAVAATNVGGHAQWMSPEYSWPIDYKLEEQFPGVFGAVVDPDSMKAVMLSLYENRQETARRAEVAARVLPSMVSWDRVLERLQDRLGVVGGPRGQEVSMLMRSCRRPAPEELTSGAAVWRNQTAATV